MSVGGVLLAWRALGQFMQGASNLVRAFVAWQEVAPIAQAADAPPTTAADPGLALRSAQQTATSERMPLLTGHQISFRYAADDAPVLANCDISISVGDRLLLEGPSGGGKSTLAGLLAGVRQPDNGLLLLNGYDQQTLGEENWRRQVVLAPQFHENFVFTGTLAFNLLMGRGWPPQAEDMQEADDICSGTGAGAIAGADARRADAGGGRERLAVVPRRAQPTVHGPGPAATGQAAGVGRKLRRPRPGQLGTSPAMRLAACPHPGGDRSSVGYRGEIP